MHSQVQGFPNIPPGFQIGKAVRLHQIFISLNFMAQFRWRLYAVLFITAFSFNACQRTWQPAAQLRPEAKIGVGERILADAAAEATIALFGSKWYSA